jgi:hypothetical protein
MVISRQKAMRKEDVKIIRIEEERGKEQEVSIYHEIVPQGKEISIWSWHEEFTLEWSETFITKKREKNLKKGK